MAEIDASPNITRREQQAILIFFYLAYLFKVEFCFIACIRPHLSKFGSLIRIVACLNAFYYRVQIERLA